MVGNWFKRSICSLSSTTIFYTTAGFEALFSKWYICAIYTIHYSPNLLYYYLLLSVILLLITIIVITIVIATIGIIIIAVIYYHINEAAEFSVMRMRATRRNSWVLLFPHPINFMTSVNY